MKECHVIEHPERKCQPFSLWVQGQIWLFARSWPEIVDYARTNEFKLVVKTEANP